MSYDSDPANRLAALYAAIDRVLSSQEYMVGGRRNQLPLLGTLERMIQRAELEVARANGTSPILQPVVMDRPLPVESGV